MQQHDRPVTLVAGHPDLGKRVDRFLADHFPGISRARLQLLIRNGLVTVDQRQCRASTLLRAGQVVLARLDELENVKPSQTVAEEIPLDVLYQDEDIIAINKPPGMVVHPARGHWSGTLTAALMHHFGPLSSAGGTHRPGIVHRLDRDTSGVIIVARNDTTHLRMMRQFEKRSVDKRYIAITSPVPDRDRDEIDAPIGPHPWQREKMAIRQESGNRVKPAKTFYEVVQRQGRFALVHVWPRTGRTHQIRVHLAHIGCPVLADRLYSGRSGASAGWIRNGVDAGPLLISRQALHAESICFSHPRTGEPITIVAPWPPDMQLLWTAICSDAGS